MPNCAHLPLNGSNIFKIEETVIYLYIPTHKFPFNLSYLQNNAIEKTVRRTLTANKRKNGERGNKEPKADEKKTQFFID